jgi:hypothetical protein
MEINMEKIFAQSVTLPGGATIQGKITWANTIGDIINRIMDYVFLFAGVGLLLMLLGGGFTYLTSMGDPKKMASASQKIILALGGFILIFVSYWIVQAVQIMFGLDFGF